MITAGSDVVWFSGSQRGRIISFRKGYGKVISIDENGIALIRTNSNRRVRKPVSKLTLRANDTPLSIITHAA